MGFFQLQYHNYQFSPNLFPSLVALFMVPSLVALGIWQLNRADEKRLIDNGVNQAQKKAALKIDALNSSQSSFDSEIYRNAIVTGKYDHEANFLLDNRTHKGKAGFHVFTPFILKSDSTKAVLINRGWIGYNGNRSNIPDISIKNDVSKISGTIKKVSESIVLKDITLNQTSIYPKVIQAISLDKLSNGMPYQFLPIILELEKSDENGFVREWQPYYGTVDKHIAYAVQWFSMAVVLFLLFIKVNTRKINTT